MSIGLARFDPKLSILAELAHGESCGVALMSELDLGPGTVYPALRDLERSGFVVPRHSAGAERQPGRPRVFYQLTPAGEVELDALQARFRNWLGEAIDSDPDGAVMTALDQLSRMAEAISGAHPESAQAAER